MNPYEKALFEALTTIQGRLAGEMDIPHPEETRHAAVITEDVAAIKAITDALYHARLDESYDEEDQ